MYYMVNVENTKQSGRTLFLTTISIVSGTAFVMFSSTLQKVDHGFFAM